MRLAVAACSPVVVLFRKILIFVFQNDAWIRDKKKLIVSRQPILINLKSNTMKNTLQRYRVLTNPQA